VGNGTGNVCEDSVGLFGGQVMPYVLVRHTIAPEELATSPQDRDGGIECYAGGCATAQVAATNIVDNVSSRIDIDAGCCRVGKHSHRLHE
jgi:hypothetical protein